MTSERTGRLYAAAQAHFADWCRDNAVTDPSHDDVARYLAHRLKHYSSSSVPVHLSAIADLFRSQGMALDTKHEAIRAVATQARRGKKAT